MLRWDVPVDPDADTAREWLDRELGNPIYHEGPSLIERFVTWFTGLFEGFAVPGLGPVWTAVTLVAVVLVVGGTALLVSGPVRRNRAVRVAPVIAAEDLRSAKQFASAAAAAAARGDFAAATLDAFRAVVRRAEERAILDPAPGRTAHEAAIELAVAFPPSADGLAGCAAGFDAIHYGHAAADRDGYLRTRDLDLALSATAPYRPVSPVGARS